MYYDGIYICDTRLAFQNENTSIANRDPPCGAKLAIVVEDAVVETAPVKRFIITADLDLDSYARMVEAARSSLN